ncbi:polymerase delta-interacting protein 3-like isoform X2 [Saccostrea echinata]|uniref:polymerase delta-interacting protein 3-like isoform X2 n=1 Tax=Saccostrea echinata TaxID=191078 RepID=UPI002A81DDD8|nr:polymerase delta-interacting protein 3-like isoform X2 [Saccostrea echinata]
MELSLDDYIGSTSGMDFHVQIRNTQEQRNIGFSGRGRGNVRGLGRGITGSKSGVNTVNFRGGAKGFRGGIRTFKSLRGGSDVNTAKFRGGIVSGSASRNLTISVPSKSGGFDARAKISANKRPLDARDKLSLKGKQTDARAKIANIQAQKMGVKTNDARMIITSKTGGQGGDVKVRVGSRDNTDSALLTRTLNTGGKQSSITRTIPGGGGKPPSSITFGQGGNPIIQIKNDQFHNPRQSSGGQLDIYYDEEEEGNVQKPMTYLVEKTLTVKKPQLLPTYKFTQEVPKRQPPVVKKPVMISTKRPSPIHFVSSDDVIDETHRELKRKASSAPVSGPLKLARTTGIVPGISAVPLERPKVLTSASVKEEEIPAELQESSGYRVIVSNLHTIVVQNDIIELFGAIGPIKRARLLKAGVAEVVYLNKEDVQKAIQKYHNRELDGLPMQVKLYTPPKPKKATPESIVGNVKDVEGPLRLGKDNPRKGSDLDVGILHKALFKTGTPNKTKVAFTVKV